MRRSSFFIAALAALVTFVSLNIFAGPRFGGRFGWHRWSNRYYYDERYNDYYYRRPYPPPYRLPADSLRRDRDNETNY